MTISRVIQNSYTKIHRIDLLTPSVVIYMTRSARLFFVGLSLPLILSALTARQIFPDYSLIFIPDQAKKVRFRRIFNMRTTPKYALIIELGVLLRNSRVQLFLQVKRAHLLLKGLRFRVVFSGAEEKVVSR